MTTFEHVVGIDLSLTCTGIASKQLHIPGGYTVKIPSTGNRGDSWTDRCNRIRSITHRVLDQIPGERSLIVMEAPAYSSSVGSVWDRAGLWWLIYEELSCSHTIVPVMPNLRAKYATGSGNSSKDEVLAAAIRRYPSWDITNNNTADAVILAAIGARLAGAPFDDGCLPAKNLDALKTLEIPCG